MLDGQTPYDAVAVTDRVTSHDLVATRLVAILNRGGDPVVD